VTALALAALLALTAACTTTSTPDASGTTPTIAPGSSWVGSFSPVALPSPVNALSDLDCVDARLCWAVGSTVGGAGAPNGAAVIATTDGGIKWTPEIIPATVGYLSGISCSDKRHCTAVGQAAQTSNGQAVIISTSDGGGEWTSAPVPVGVLDLTAIACRPNHRCVAVGTGVGTVVTLVSTSPTGAWTQAGTLPLTMNGATDISCSDARSCWVTAHTSVDVDHVAGTVALTTDGAGSWATVSTPPGIGYLNGVSCLDGPAPTTSPSTTPTAAATPTTTTAPPAASTSSSTTVTTAPAPAPTTTTAPPAPIVGVAGVRCTIVGTTAQTLNGARAGHGVILSSDNGGATWSRQSVAPTAAALMGVSCPAVGTCAAAGSSIATSTMAGVAILTGSTDHPWKKAAVVGFPQPLTAISCVSTAHCVVVGESISEHLG
jgi:hypothetical protein